MTSRDYRASAREMLSGKWGRAVLVTLIAGLLGGLATGSGFSVNIDQDTLSHFPKALLAYLAIAGSILATVQFILSGTVQLGYCKYLLKLYDGQDGDIHDLFSEFHRFADGFILSLLTSIYIILWSLLCVIPGIVAAYKYAMAPFILQENPGMKPSEAITASKEMMDGRKMELFLLSLSFIGWTFLSVLTLGIGYLWLNPYMNAAYAAFYRENRYVPAATPAFDPNEPHNPW